MTQLTRSLVEVLTQHYVTAIECNHEAKTDIVRCSCSVWTGTSQPSVGAAARQWAEHVAAIMDDMADTPFWYMDYVQKGHDGA